MRMAAVARSVDQRPSATGGLDERVSGAVIRIGCSGWNYASWRESFYPKGLAASRWLEHYAAVFDTVEVNTTFYRLAQARVGRALGDARRRRASASR